MLDFPVAEKDPLFALSHRFRADPRPEKLDLVLGVYRDEQGQTPVMDVVCQAELELAEQRLSKSYRSLSGHTRFNAGMVQLLLGDALPRARQIAALQTVGGTGALSLLAGMIAVSSPGTMVWSSDPGYVNHRPICEGAGLPIRPYRLRSKAGMADIALILEDLEAAQSGDVVLLHGCCHNPTGLEMDLNSWSAVADLCERKALIPFVDMAYQGFGLGLEEDAIGLRLLVERLETVLVAASCSKNMGLYCERTGAALVIASSTREASNATAVLENLAWTNYSMPPDHGASVASLVFQRYDLWKSELEAMRQRIVALRGQLVDCLRQTGVSRRLLDIHHHSGMFSVLPFNAKQMEFLRQEYSIYGTDGARINVAGLSTADVPYLVRALKETSGILRT